MAFNGSDVNSVLYGVENSMDDLSRTFPAGSSDDIRVISHNALRLASSLWFSF